MAVYVTGDIHGDVTRLGKHSFFEQKEFQYNKNENVIIVCGDFGCVWDSDGENNEEKYWLNWLQDKPFTTVFCDGNHENFTRLNNYPVKEWNGGKVHEIRPNVLHLMRGEIYNIENRKFFVFGGASSHDISDGILDGEHWKEQAKKLIEKGKYMFRVKNVSWWEEELPNEYEMNNALNNLEKYDYDVDYVITHSPPASVIALLGKGLYEQDILTKFLEEIRNKLIYSKWFMGHMHLNRSLNEKDILLYEQIIRIV